MGEGCCSLGWLSCCHLSWVATSWVAMGCCWLGGEEGGHKGAIREE